jgi:lipopolysaccharide biosynthesis glycosyltransferase
MTAFRIFIGYDSREEIAWKVARNTLLKHSSIPLDIRPVVQGELRRAGLYTRDKDPLSSTEFSFTRFLVPHLAGYKGWCLFVDCDFLFRKDIASILDYTDTDKAVLVVKHDYAPSETTKMDGCPQSVYPKKNWSSFILWNTEAEESKLLTPDIVNIQSGMYLHQFKWIPDPSRIGSLPITYNYLEGWYTRDQEPDPIAVHFTRGGPWFPQYQHVEYNMEWNNAAVEVLQQEREGE